MQDLFCSGQMEAQLLGDSRMQGGRPSPTRGVGCLMGNKAGGSYTTGEGKQQAGTVGHVSSSVLAIIEAGYTYHTRPNPSLRRFMINTPHPRYMYQLDLSSTALPHVWLGSTVATAYFVIGSRVGFGGASFRTAKPAAPSSCLSFFLPIQDLFLSPE